jgi:hypothetical protein
MATQSTALAPPGAAPLSLQVSSVDDLARLAKVFAASGLFGRSGNQETQVAECAIRLMAGMEAGFSPFASATGIHIIKGRPAFSANLLAQAVRRHPAYDYRVLEKTAKVCRIQFLCRGEILGIETFTMEMAERAGLLAGNAERGIPAWKAYPEAMLFSRALTAGMRTHCPDALGGHTAYSPEELGAAEVVPVTVTEAPPAVIEPDLATPALEVCKAAGLTPEGLVQFCLLVSDGELGGLIYLPTATLERIISQGISAETVAKCNAIEPEPTDDPDDLPAAWSA